MIPRLAAEIPRLMARAEVLFGPCEAGWGAPELHQMPNGPMAIAARDPQRVMIFLGTQIASYDQGLYQLSHEIIHALGNNYQSEANMLEEGTAVWFSLYGHGYPMDSYLSAAEHRLTHSDEAKDYLAALKLYNELASVYPGAIRLLRQHDPKLDRQTPATIRAILPGVSADLAGRLCDRRGMRP